MTNLDKAIKPCPFCGSEAELEHGSDHHGQWFNLGCSRHWGNVDPDRACVGGRLWYTETEKSEAEAIAAWNTRQALSDLSSNKLEPGDVEWACNSLELRRKVAWAARGAEAEAHNARIDRLLSALGHGAT